MTPRRVGGAAALVAFVATLVALWRVFGPGDDPPDTARLSVDGEAEILTPSGEVVRVTGDETVEFGTRVVMIAGTAEVSYDDTELELRAGLDGRPDTEVTVDQISVLAAGDLLVEVPTTTTLVVGPGTVTVERGAAQVDLRTGGEGAVVRAYQGRARVAAGAAEGSVLGLRTLSFSSDLVDGTAPPIDYRPTDPWDRRFLGDAIAFGDDLQRKSLGLVRNLAGGTEVDAVFLRRVLPDLDDSREFRTDLVEPDRDEAESLTGASIVSLGRRGTLAERWEAVFAFRDAGAHWGIVALDQGVNEAPALEAIDLAIQNEELAFTGPPPTSPTTVAPDPGPAPGPPPTSPPPTSPPPTSPPPTTPPPTTPPPESPLEPVDELVDDLLGDLLDGLLGGSGGDGLLGGSGSDDD